MLDELISPMDSKKNNLAKKRVLLAEDDISMRRFIEVTLKRANYEVVSAEDGLAAMQTALSENFDAVVTDAVMPNLTGHDLCRILRQNANYKESSLIILSGLEKDIARNSANDCADLYLLKDENLKEELTKNLSKLLSQNTGKK